MTNVTESAEELKTKVHPLTIAIMVILVGLGFGIGFNYASMQNQIKLQEIQHGFALDEVHGLRSDVNREVELLRQELKSQKEWNQELEGRIEAIERK